MTGPRDGVLRRRSVRLRAAVAASIALAPALVAVSVAGVLVQRHQLTAGVEVLAREHARTVGAERDAGGSPTLLSSIGGESTLVQVVDARGRVVSATATLQGRDPLVDPVVGAPASRLSGVVRGEEDHYLVVVEPSGADVVVAAESLEGVDDATASTVRLLVVGDPLLVVLVAALTFLLVGRALRPVEALRARAGIITAADQSARLPVVTTGDEVERLAHTLNEMLSRLELSALAQRRFVADASHELRSPVATIRTLHEVGAAGGLRTDWQEVSADVLTETSRLERLVDDLLLLARPRTPPERAVEALDLGALVREEGARARSCSVSVLVTPGVVVIGHHDSLARALRNLLDNGERHAASAVTVELSTAGDHAVVTVHDDGSGIATADRERVFERFVRLDEARTRDAGGSGLGLSITRHLVEAHGGRVVVGASSRGAVVVVELPLAGEEHAVG